MTIDNARRDDLTAETLSEGYLYTNDLAYMSADGFVYMLGRTDDIINAGGEKVAPVEVENAASQHSLVAVCACIGGEDSKAESCLFLWISKSGCPDSDLQ